MVSFNTNGGTSVAPQQVSEGEFAAEPTAPTKSADAQYTYTFAGWYTDSSLETAFNFAEDAITADITLYAKWTATAVEYTITFDTNGGTAIPQQVLTYGSLITQPADPTKDGTDEYDYVFNGWFKDSTFHYKMKDYAYIVYVDSLSCSDCAINHLSDWTDLTLTQYLNDNDLSLLFIISPPKNKIKKIMKNTT